MSSSHSRFGVDSNGRPTETRVIDGHEICIHDDDIPDSDVTSIDGIPVTTALRTVIDIASDLTPGQLHEVVEDGLRRDLFSLTEADARLAQPDLADHRGAELLHAHLRR